MVNDVFHSAYVLGMSVIVYIAAKYSGRRRKLFLFLFFWAVFFYILFFHELFG